MGKYNKFWVALGAGAGVLLFACAPDANQAAFVLTRTELFQVVVAFAGAFGVYQTPNES